VVGLTPFSTPRAEAATYRIPCMALAVYIRRFGVPSRLARLDPPDVRLVPRGWRASSASEAYTTVALPLAAAGWGGWSIVAANNVKSIVAVVILIQAAGIRSWATPTPLRMERVKDMLKFGLPLGIQGIAHMASRYWDNLAVSSFFGTTATGAYNMAYNLADIPAIQVGEQIAQVLMPSMAALPPHRRPRALERSSALLSLIIFPLAIGLGLVAYPLIGLILPADKWQEVAPLMPALACCRCSGRSPGCSAYMEAESNEPADVPRGREGRRHRRRHRGAVAARSAHRRRLGRHRVRRDRGRRDARRARRRRPSPWRLFVGFFQPLVACAVMFATVLGVGRAADRGCGEPRGLSRRRDRHRRAAYVIAALVICRETSRDLLGLLKKTPSDAPEIEPPRRARDLISSASTMPRSRRGNVSERGRREPGVRFLRE
jgi:hypothetical protein